MSVQTASWKGLHVIFNTIIETERTLFNKSYMLEKILNFLVTNSDGDNLQCRINVFYLDYLMNKYVK
jgi:hypothetical protein